MWGLDWFKKRKSKKVFRLIAIHAMLCNKNSFPLSIPRKIFTNTQKLVIERIIEKNHKEIRCVQPIQRKTIYFQRIYHNHILCPPKHKKKDISDKEALRKEVKRLYYVSFKEEQEYFRTRPTMARRVMKNMMLGNDGIIMRGGEHVRAIHLEILKHTIDNEVEHQTKPYSPPMTTASQLNYALISEIIHQVRLQMKKEAWRTGGKELWKK